MLGEGILLLFMTDGGGTGLAGSLDLPPAKLSIHLHKFMEQDAETETEPLPTAL